jgi:hypothetical protein
MKFDSYQEWSKAFTQARKEVGNIDLVMELWQAKVSSGWERQDWRSCTLGYRKNSKEGAENAGEKLIERRLLGCSSKLKTWRLSSETSSYTLKTVYNNFALANTSSGQVIADVLGVLERNGVKLGRPLLVEVKTTNGGPWHALVECLKQVSLARRNEKAICDKLKKDNVSSGPGSWGLVIAPKKFWNKQLKECESLMSVLKTKTRARIGFVAIDDTIDELQWVLGNWN